MKAGRDQIRVGRVLSETETTLTLEVHKSNATPYTLSQALDPDAEPDRFYTLMFVRQDGERAVAWLPWEAK